MKLGAELPLIIFEARYLNMIKDSIVSHRVIGMVQPVPNGKTSIRFTALVVPVALHSSLRSVIVVSKCVCHGYAAIYVGEELSATLGYRFIGPDGSRFADDYVDYTDRVQGDH